MFFGGDPFEHFAGMHGGPGGPGGMRGPPKDVDTTKLYETLGVSDFVRGPDSWREKTMPRALHTNVNFHGDRLCEGNKQCAAGYQQMA